MTSRQTPPTFDCAGSATNGKKYESISAMWQSELATETSKRSATAQHWYEKSAEYWQHQSASIQGMLGGLGELDARDVNASHKFLDALERLHPFPTQVIALDVGAGIGRVTKHLLAPRYNTVDMLEQNPKYLKESVAFVGQEMGARIDRRIACGMQSFRADGLVDGDGVTSGPFIARYHLIWIQWCIIYLTDEDLINFLRECVRALAPAGIICLKDNVARAGFLVDKEDSSIMRSDKYLKHLFRSAGLDVIKETKQVDFPKHLFPVRSYALRPKLDKECTATHNLTT